jgi:2-polyprenyl-3-methyl-5-hydroxy-6-metoxy-1,4-benzoquinol methylase
MGAARVDFGRTAPDYARHRAGFPEAFFERLLEARIVRPGLRLLDLGTGTGTLARGFAKRGLEVTGLDIAPALLETAEELDREAGVIPHGSRTSLRRASPASRPSPSIRRSPIATMPGADG